MPCLINEDGAVVPWEDFNGLKQCGTHAERPSHLTRSQCKADYIMSRR